MGETAIAVGESLFTSASKLFGGLWGYVAIAAVAAGLAGFGAYKVTAWAKDETINQLKLADAKAQTDAVTLALAHQRASDAASAAADVALLTAWTDTRTKFETITREIPIHVTPETDARFPLPCGFVRMHDAAVHEAGADAVPNPAGKSDGDACEVTASQALNVISANYRAFYTNLDQLNGWIAWAKAQEALAPQPVTEK